MKSVKPCYVERIKSVSNRLCSDGGDFCFAVVADSHLDNSLEDTIANVHAVDAAANFDCFVHLGDFLNGNLPLKHTRRILGEQMELFRSATDCPFYPVQGNHDGYWRYNPTRGVDTAEDEIWDEAIAYLRQDNRVKRVGNKPYFYVDFAEKKIRLVVLCSFYYEIVEGRYRKKYGTDDAQVQWLKEQALAVDKDWTVLLFSHDSPVKDFNENAKDDVSRYNGQTLIRIVNEARAERGFAVPGWFIGHHHYDFCGEVMGINMICVGSETAYVFQLWDQPCWAECFDRNLGTDSEDLWDAVVLDKQNRMLRLYRVGAGKDRSICY